jgi:hypothetical protein
VKSLFISSCLLVSAITGCAANRVDLASTNLAGTVSGQAWSFQAGNTNAFLSQGQDDFFATFYPTAFTACGTEPNGRSLIVSVPKVVGDFDMGLSRNMTFVEGSNNLVATEGRVRVDSVTATTVVGALHGIYNDANEVNGTFTITICP